jgi:hypothetical protein
MGATEQSAMVVLDIPAVEKYDQWVAVTFRCVQGL